MDWILGLDVDDQNAVIMWLYGPAGAGKSAITHDIARRSDLEKLLLASFFFSRSDPTRSNAKSLIATIAYQIAINIPGTRGSIVEIIERDPLILTRSLEAQVASLIVNPLREPLEAGYFSAPTSRRLIIIDGLDECDTPATQCSILQIISRIFRDYRLPLLVFVASRPERHLTHSFTTGTLPEFHTTLALDDTYKPDDDIRLFLTDSFREVKDTHPMRRYLDHLWPSVEVLEKLVEKSSGQFVYASTVVKYISSIRHQPADRLAVVLGIRPPRHAREMPFGELDALYRHIFTALEEKETVLLILGFWLLSSSRYPRFHPGDIEDFFLLNRGDIEVLFGDLSSVITISEVNIRILHASLSDFLLDAARSKEFYIDFANIHTRCMQLCFHHTKQCTLSYFLSKEVTGHPCLIDSISNDHGTHIIYAGQNISWHCENTPLSASLQLREELMNFSFDRPDSCFAMASTQPGTSLFFFVPEFLKVIENLVCLTFFAHLIQYIEHMEQPLDGVDKIYNQKQEEILDFFKSKLPLYYSSSRLTLLLTLLEYSSDRFHPMRFFGPEYISLPSRLKMMDRDALNFMSVPQLSGDWNIFRNFLGSDHPLALDGQRYATAALTCLKIIFKHYQVPLLCFQRFRRHILTPSVDMEQIANRRDVKSLPGWKNFLETHFSTSERQGIPEIHAALYLCQRRRTIHLGFLLRKSAYSDNLLNFARCRVFRFGYLCRKHPTHMKQAIFALAKYIHQVTGGTAEVRACESIWGRDKWFTAE